MVTNLGFEYFIVDNFAFRGGFMNDPSGELSYTTLGLGARLDPIGFDVSYVMAVSYTHLTLPTTPYV